MSGNPGSSSNTWSRYAAKASRRAAQFFQESQRGCTGHFLILLRQPAAMKNACNRPGRSAIISGRRSSSGVKKYAAEFIGTFALVFAGTGAIVVNEVSQGAITHVGIALTFGLIVLVMIYTLGDIS